MPYPLRQHELDRLIEEQAADDSTDRASSESQVILECDLPRLPDGRRMKLEDLKGSRPDPIDERREPRSHTESVRSLHRLPRNPTVHVFLGHRPWPGPRVGGACPVCANRTLRGAEYCGRCDRCAYDGRKRYVGEPVDSRLNEGWNYSRKPREDDGLRGGIGG